MREIFINEDVDFETTFINDAGEPFNQTSVSLTIVTPNFEVIPVTSGITNPSPGVYQYNYRVLLKGFYAYIFTGVDSFGKQSIHPEKIRVRQPY